MGASKISEYGSSVEGDPGGEGSWDAILRRRKSSCPDGAHGLSVIGSEADTMISNMECVGGNSQRFLRRLRRTGRRVGKDSNRASRAPAAFAANDVASSAD
jgi:hypothetical protein